ncbi:MAG: hypothetical protein A3E01_18615 [Gammaproteobacteria bacterium RIFCSPHIGHO2_12_FULL_63_22]|nr:MAG: hypothetical protein A3E01_18615 [Gammaproteobacteria bacterium RIFCSPHIGHO2_12_FULL_63_22]
MNTASLSPLRCGLSLAVTATLLYVGCALVVAWAPGALAAGLGVIVHGLSLSELTPAVGQLRWGAVLIGTLAVAGYAFVAGALFGAVHRWIGGGR